MIPVHVDHDKPFNADELDPGIRKTVLLLRSWGFKTTDSGDGVTKVQGGYDPRCVLPFPHVAMICDPEALITESQRLLEILVGYGIDMGELAEDWSNLDTLPGIEASYSPLNGTSFLILSNISDAAFPKSVLDTVS